MRADGAFRALLLLVGAAAAQTVGPSVPAPTDVKASCDNFRTSVQWKYSRQTPQTRFLVKVGKSAGPHNTSEHQYTVDSSFWSSMETLMDTHSFYVTATQGGARSEEVSGTFSFSDAATVHTTCKLDLPPLDLRHSGTELTFPNPTHYYPELRWAAETTVTFEVATEQWNKQETCGAEVCRWESAEAADECVNVTAWLKDPNGSQTVKLSMKRVCSNDPPDLMLLAIVLVCILCLAILAAALVIYKCKAYELSKPPQSDFLSDFLHREPAETQRLAMPSDGPICRVEVVDDSSHPAKTPEAEELLPEGGSSDGDSGRTESEILEPEESEEEVEEGQGYERRDAIVHLDLGDGEMVTGYGGG